MKNLKFTNQDLVEKARKRPQGFQKEILENSIVLDSNTFEISFEKFEEIENKYRLPARLEMFKSLLGAADSVLSSSFADIHKRSPEQIQQCAEICSSCDYLVEDGMRCGKCGCFLRIKMQLNTWNCPLKKWPIIPQEEYKSDYLK